MYKIPQGPVSIEFGIGSRQQVVSSEQVKVVVGKERKGRRAINNHRINGRLMIALFTYHR
jgi:hypothetical protein